MINSKMFQGQFEKVTPEIKKEMDWSAEIVKRIEQILEEKGITQRELASRIGCNETQIVRWTRGFPNYTLSTLAKLSVALGEDLIGTNPSVPAKALRPADPSGSSLCQHVAYSKDIS